MVCGRNVCQNAVYVTKPVPDSSLALVNPVMTFLAWSSPRLQIYWKISVCLSHNITDELYSLTGWKSIIFFQWKTIFIEHYVLQDFLVGSWNWHHGCLEMKMEHHNKRLLVISVYFIMLLWTSITSKYRTILSSPWLGFFSEFVWFFCLDFITSHPRMFTITIL